MKEPFVIESSKIVSFDNKCKSAVLFVKYQKEDEKFQTIHTVN